MAGDNPQRELLEALLDRLRALRVEGPSRGGPYVGIVHNDLTRKILAAGESVVPLLIARLDGSSFDEAVYIIFLLRELHAAQALPAVRKLQSEIERRSVGRDLTLKMQVEYFLRDSGAW